MMNGGTGTFAALLALKLVCMTSANECGKRERAGKMDGIYDGRKGDKTLRHDCTARLKQPSVQLCATDIIPE